MPSLRKAIMLLKCSLYLPPQPSVTPRIIGRSIILLTENSNVCTDTALCIRGPRAVLLAAIRMHTIPQSNYWTRLLTYRVDRRRHTQRHTGQAGQLLLVGGCKKQKKLTKTNRNVYSLPQRRRCACQPHNSLGMIMQIRDGHAAGLHRLQPEHGDPRIGEGEQRQGVGHGRKKKARMADGCSTSLPMTGKDQSSTGTLSALWAVKKQANIAFVCWCQLMLLLKTQFEGI